MSEIHTTTQNDTIQENMKLYGISSWGHDYFSINDKGNILVTPKGFDKPGLDLYQLTQDLVERGVRLPLLIRFSDIVEARVQLLSQSFANAIKEYGFNGNYQGVYPLKVNQQRHLVEELMKFGIQNNLGLECGSKPELLVALAQMNCSNGFIICNGFKDSEYIETALLAQKLGLKIILVVDRPMELGMILSASKKLKIHPRIGFRAKLTSKGSGKWTESSGSRSKFGLTSYEIIEGINTLKVQGSLQYLELLHFHIGSQITSIQAIKASLKEASRFYTEIYHLGVKPKFLDVGGGLGIDYDGSGKSESSINYNVQEYANDVVSIIQDICDEKKIPHPTIITESGRSLVAHTSVLIFNILGVHEVRQQQMPPKVTEKDHQILQNLQYMCDNLNETNLNESFNDLSQIKEEILQFFTYGVLNLNDRSRAEKFYWALITKMAHIASTLENEADMLSNLNQLLSDTYFCNFSIFQSLPDAWAIDQIFPVLPIHRLNEKPNRRAQLVDLTCDSDGKIETFYDLKKNITKNTLEVHSIDEENNYYLGTFLTGAYQEILGDLHNLFGDTDAINISLSDKGHYQIDSVVKGDTVKEVLHYVQYNEEELLEKIRVASEKSISEGDMSKQEAKSLLQHYQISLDGYTYLRDSKK